MSPPQEPLPAPSPGTPSPSSRPWDALPLPAGPPPDERPLLRRLRSRLMRLAPRPLVRLLARPYVAGETRAEAIALAHRLHAQRGVCSTLDVLGEDLRDPAESVTMRDEYLAILDDLGLCPFANISIKLSALGQALDEELCARNLETLLQRAAAYQQFVRFDMEDHTTTDATLATYRRFVGRYPRIGVVLQSRLHRTSRDVAALAPLKPNVRLCLGIYREPAAIALQDKPAMKKRLLELLDTMWDNGQYVAIATHDEAVIERALEMAERKGKTPRDFEVQMLLGVPRARIQQRLMDQGVRVRLYVPYGTHWYHYCLRRLDNNPEMARMVLGNLLRRGGSR
jgi:proline dehydrogenase